MLRSASLLGLALVSLSSLFLGGCIAETSEPTGIVWYDDEVGACFETGKDGKPVEVPCDETYETMTDEPEIGCTTPDDCTRPRDRM
jgi:hypothetical protein